MKAIMKKIGKSAVEVLRGMGDAAKDRTGMELVQCAILVAIAVALGLLFRSEITSFVNNTFSSLSEASF